MGPYIMVLYDGMGVCTLASYTASREKAMLRKEEKDNLKRQSGDRSRLAWEKRLRERRTQEVLRVQVHNALCLASIRI